MNNVTHEPSSSFSKHFLFKVRKFVNFHPMEDHAYCAQKSLQRQPPSVKRKYDAARRIRDRRRQKSRINIGVAFPRWRAIKQNKCFQSDAEFACFLLDSVYGKQVLAQGNRRRLKKSTHVPAPQIKVEPESDSSHPNEDHQSSDEDEDEDRKGPEICYDIPAICETDKAVQTELKSEDQLDLDVCNDSIPTLHNGNIVPQCSTSHKITKEKPAETQQQPESKLEVSTSPVTTSDIINHSFVQTPNPLTVENSVGHKEKTLVPRKSHLMALFPNCLQCEEPVLEYTTTSSGNQNRVQWKCSKGHLMWLFPNSNPT